MRTTETTVLLETVKALLRKKGVTYGALAKELGLSLPAVKRTMNSPAIPLGRLEAICDVIGISLADAATLARGSGHENFYFTEAQERFFAREPHYLAYLFEVLELSPAEIEKKHGISPKSTRRYLRKLEELGLLEVHPGDKIKTQIRGAVFWDDDGILGATFSRSMLRNISAHAEKKLGAPGDLHLAMHGWNLNALQYTEFRREYEELARKYRDLSTFNRKALGRRDTKYVSAMFVSDYWEDPFFREVKELR